jgi:hypothetical protein
VAKILPESGLYQKIIHRTEKLLIASRKLRPRIRKKYGWRLDLGLKICDNRRFP